MNMPIFPGEYGKEPPLRRRRKHHNNTGLRQIKNGACEKMCKLIAERMGIKYGKGKK